MFRTLVIALAACGFAGTAFAVEHVTVTKEGAATKLSGKVLVEADDGILLLTPDNQLHALESKNIERRERDDAPFALLSGAELEKEFAAQLEGFHVHRTEHYLIFYNTSKAYAEWCGLLYERLYKAYYAYWEDRGLVLTPSDAPLVAILFQTKDSYLEYAKREFGGADPPPYGYYNLDTNHVLAYDLTGVEGATFRERGGTSAKVNAILSRPGAEGTVATIIHEATHQLAFNSGLHQRRADIPRWLSEGMAVYFESPDLKSSRGWTRIGIKHRTRLARFHQYLRTRPADSLGTLLSSDARLVDARTADDAYAEAWALNYYLIRNHQKAYVAYLQKLAAKGPLELDSPEERLADFQAAFGDDVAKLDAAFVKYMAKER